MNTQKSGVFQKVEIGVASPKQIRYWAERFLPNGDVVGEVTSWETVNYKTLKPEPNGLFCQKIFGPVVDFTCACGKKSTKSTPSPKAKDGSRTALFGAGFCPKCGVERTQSRVRRYRLGYIKLKQPVVHPLYAAHRPSPVVLCLDWATKRFQSVMRTVEFCYLPQYFTIFGSRQDFTEFYAKLEQKNLSPLIWKETDSKNTLSNKESTSKHSNFKTSSRLNEQFSGTNREELQNSKDIEFTSKATSPRLFTRKKQTKRPNLTFNLGGSEARLYGLTFDESWRQVEDFQEFLFYLWEQSFFYESAIPYYTFTKPIQRFADQIPKHELSYAIQTGGFALQHILLHLDGERIQKEFAIHFLKAERRIRQLKEEMANLNLSYFDDRLKFKRLRIKLNKVQQFQLKRKRQLGLFRDFSKAKMQAAWMILSYLPVLPPGLRPITSIRGELVVSDINSLYRKVLIRNKRITRGVNFGIFDTALSGSWLSWCYNVRQVQEAVDELLKKGSVESGRPLKSLLDGLKGKQGRFRQHLLGKRVDYSGRSVIVVGPKLKIHQCGLPKQMAVELFQPFIIQKLRKKGIVFTTTAAKALIAERKPIIWSILSEILKTHPILLNRAPTLHRLGIQAFLPQLVEGKAILLHPLVCPAFNADFDGDQMAVHVPLSPKTRAEALDLLWARNHLLAPASGQPLLLPTQDMVLGFYYLTCSTEKFAQKVENLIPSREALIQNRPWTKNQLINNLVENPNNSNFSFFPLTQNPEFLRNNVKNQLYFSDFLEVKQAYDRGFLNLHTPIWVNWSGFIQTFIPKHYARLNESLVEIRLDRSGRQETVFLESCKIRTPNKLTSLATVPKATQFIRTTTGRVLMHSWIFQGL